MGENMKYYVGIDLGGMSAKCALLKEGVLVGTSRCETDKTDPAEKTAARLASIAEEAIAKSGVSREEVAGVGIGSPGIIDSKCGVVVSWTNFSWTNVPLARLVGEKLGLPVYVLNDANAAALGEYAYGAGKEYDSAVMITIGTGIGSGIVFDGKIFEGNGGAGGELGHEVIRMGGEKCSCGSRGCFEAYASASALIRQTKKAMIAHPESLLWNLCEGNADNANGIVPFQAMRAGDKTAKGVVARYLKYLGEGVVNAANIFRPQAVILGGGICAEGETLTRPLQRKADKEKVGGTSSVAVKIVTASLGNAAGIYGAAEFAAKGGNV